MIQKWYRYFVAFNNYKHLKFLMKQATIIQRYYRLFQLKNNCKKKVLQLK